MSDKIPDDQSNSSDPQKEFLNEDMSIEDNNKTSDVDECSIMHPSSNGSDSTYGDYKDTASTNPNEVKQKKSSPSFENSIQESLLLGIQESLEALFDMGIANTSGQPSSYPKTPNVTVVEGGKLGVKNSDETENQIVDGERVKNDLSSRQDMKENIETILDRPSFLEIVKDDHETDESSTKQTTSPNSPISDLQEHIQNMFGHSSIGQNSEFDIPNIDLSHLGIDNVEVRVINAGELDDISQIQDLIGQIYDDSSNTDDSPCLEGKKPSFEVFTQDDVLSFEERKGLVSEERHAELKSVDDQNFESIPDGSISVVRNEHQKIYYGLNPRTYRILCDVGTLSVFLYERPEYRDVHDDYDLIERTLVTLTTGQSIDVEHVHIAVVGHDDTTSKGRYFQI